KAIVLSGGPYYVHDEYRYRIEEAMLELNIPVLGICYGMQLLTDYYGGNVEHTAKRSYEVKTVQINEESPLFAGLSKEQTVFASAGDQITEVPDSFIADATDENGDVAAFHHQDRPLYGVQFYPEVADTTKGKEILQHFLFSINHKVYPYDMASLIHKSIGNQQYYILLKLTLLRKYVGKKVKELLKYDFYINIIQSNSEEQYLSKFNCLDNPEEKRKII